MSVAFSRSATFRSAVLITGSTYVSYVTGLAVSVLIARSLGPGEYGRYAYIVWLSGILLVLCNNGLTISGIRFVSESIGRSDTEAARRVHSALGTLHNLSLVIVAALFTLAAPFIEPAGWERSLWLFGAVTLVSALAKSGYLFSSSIAKGYGDFGIEAITTNTMSLVNLAGVTVLWILKGTLTQYLLLFASVSAGHSLITSVLMRRRKIQPAGGELEASVKGRIREHLVWSTILTMVGAFGNRSVETILLNSLVGAEAVGFFAIAAALARGGIDLLSSGLSGVLMPAMSHAFGAGGVDAVNRILSDAVRYFAFLGLFLAGVGGLWASPVVTILYGAQYLVTIRALQVMMVVGGLTLAGGAFGALLSTTDNQRLRAYYAVAAIVVSALCAVLLVPPYGLNGALASIAVSQLIVMALGPIGVRRFMKLDLPMREIVRLLAAALLAAAVALPGLFFSRSPWSQLAMGGLYGISYMAFTVVLRVWHTRDIETLSPLTRRLPLMGHVERVLRYYAPLQAQRKPTETSA